jgi:hypothetical protein
VEPRDARTLAHATPAEHDRMMIDPERAMAIARRVHAGHREEGGSPVLRHIGRVARATPAEARAVAWLHEALESGVVTEQELLADRLGDDELRALRLLARMTDTRSERAYLAHVELIARAAGHSGELARLVKIADLEDRCRHPRVRPDGWSPPYERALGRLRQLDDADQLLPMAASATTRGSPPYAANP